MLDQMNQALVSLDVAEIQVTLNRNRIDLIKVFRSQGFSLAGMDTQTPEHTGLVLRRMIKANPKTQKENKK